MLKFITFIIISFLFVGCSGGGSSSSSEVVTNTDDTVPVIEEPVIPSEDSNTTDSGIPLPVAKSTIPMLSILINYNNISVSSSQTVWSAKLYGEDAHELNNYYLESSHQNFEFARATESGGVVNDGIVSVKLNKNHPDTSIDNFTAFSTNVYPDLKSALVALDGVIYFKDYDTNADGHITPDELLLTFIMAGYEDAYEGRHVTNGVWAHQYCMESLNTPTLDGVTLMGCANDGNFALFGEKHNIANPHDATIGIIAHELGHSAFHLPDLYNTQENTGGIGYFGLMGAGTWARQSSTEFYGATPTHFCAWSKYYNGWVTPKTVTGSTTLTETSSLNYDVIKIPINKTSYYLLENRNNSGYDKGLYSLDGVFNGGMALWKIDETKLTSTYFNSNTVNADTDNKAVDLVEARAGTIDTSADGGDEDALYYLENVSSFGTLITDISARSSEMGLIVH
jgi:M6 family metalloprotease-like protein